MAGKCNNDNNKWASASQIAKMMGPGTSTKMAEFLKSKLARYQVSKKFRQQLKGAKKQEVVSAEVSVGSNCAHVIAQPPATFLCRQDKLPPPSGDFLNNMRFIAGKLLLTSTRKWYWCTRFLLIFDGVHHFHALTTIFTRSLSCTDKDSGEDIFNQIIAQDTNEAYADIRSHYDTWHHLSAWPTNL